MENRENKNLDSAQETEAQKAYVEELKKAGIVSQEAPPEVKPEEQPQAPELEAEAPKKISREEEKIQETVAALEKLHEEHLGVKETVEQEPEVDVEKVPELKIAETEKDYTPKERLLALKSEVESLGQEIVKAKERRKNILESGFKEKSKPAIEEVRKLEEQEKNILKEIEEARKEVKKQAAETLSAPDVMKMRPRAILESFRDITENEKGESRHLFKERDEMVKQNMEARKMKIIPGNKAEEYRATLIAKEEVRINSEERSVAIATCWERLSAKQKQQFGAPDSQGFQNYLQGKREKLGVPEDDFYNLVRAGIVPEQMKKRGRFMGAILGDFKVIDSRYPKPLEMSKEEFNKLTAGLQNGRVEAIMMAAERHADRMIEEGRKALRTEKDVCAKKIIEQTIADYNSEQQKEQKAEMERQVLKAKRTPKVSIKGEKKKTPGIKFKPQPERKPNRKPNRKRAKDGESAIAA